MSAPDPASPPRRLPGWAVLLAIVLAVGALAAAILGNVR